MFCDFEIEKEENNLYHLKCRNCKCTRVSKTGNFTKACKMVEEKDIILIDKVQKFAMSLFEFISKDKGEFLSKEKIMERFDICKACPFFTGSRCSKCGCGIKGRKSLLNKLAYPSQKCPDNRW